MSHKRPDWLDNKPSPMLEADESSLALPIQSKSRSNIDVKEYTDKMNNMRKQQSLNKDGLKIVVTDFALDHWMAQSYGIDITNLQPKTTTEDSP